MSSPGDALKPWGLLLTYVVIVLAIGGMTLAWWLFLA
jgi:hypothetical protein